MKPARRENAMRRMLRRPAVQDMLGLGRSALYEFISEGLMTPPIKANPGMGAGNQLVWWPSDEVEAIQSARIAGYGDSQIKALVSGLVEARKKLPVLVPNVEAA